MQIVGKGVSRWSITAQQGVHEVVPVLGLVPHELHGDPLDLVVYVIDLLFVFLIYYLILLFKLYAEEELLQHIIEFKRRYVRDLRRLVEVFEQLFYHLPRLPLGILDVGQERLGNILVILL